MPWARTGWSRPWPTRRCRAGRPRAADPHPPPPGTSPRRIRAIRARLCGPLAPGAGRQAASLNLSRFHTRPPRDAPGTAAATSPCTCSKAGTASTNGSSCSARPAAARRRSLTSRNRSPHRRKARGGHHPSPTRKDHPSAAAEARLGRHAPIILAKLPVHRCGPKRPPLFPGGSRPSSTTDTAGSARARAPEISVPTADLPRSSRP